MKCSLLCSNCHRKLHANTIQPKLKYITKNTIKKAAKEAYRYDIIVS